MEIRKIARVFIYLFTRITDPHTVWVRTTLRIHQFLLSQEGFQYSSSSGGEGLTGDFYSPVIFSYIMRSLFHEDVCAGSGAVCREISHFSAEAPALHFSQI